MSFLAPLGLLALLTIPLIVLLHLIRERRRRMVVPSLLLWELLPQRQDSRKRRRLPFTLLLLIQLLIAALLALALGQPRWLRNLFGAERHLALVIDLSTSMAARDPALGGASRLDAARERARAIIGELGERDSVALISAGPLPRLAAPLAPAGALVAAQSLETLAIEGNGAALAEALLLAQASLEDVENGEVVVLTDGALADLESQEEAQPQAYPVRWEVLGGPLDNRAVVTLAARARGTSAGGATQLFARIANFGAAPARSQVRLFGDDQLLDSRQAEIGPDGTSELTWALPAGLSSVRVEIDGGDGLPIDDSASLSLAQVRPVATLLISASPALERALRAVPGLNISLLSPAEYAAAPRPADLTIFDGTLPAALPEGGVLLINPPLNAGPPLATGGRSRPADDAALLTQRPALFSGLSLGGIEFGALREVEPPEWAEVVLSYGDSPLVLRGRSGASEVAIWTFDMAEGNLTSRLAFPLLVARTVRDLTPSALPGSLLLGEELHLSPSPRATSLEIVPPEGPPMLLTLAEGDALPPVVAQQAGIYRVIERAGQAEILQGSVAVNVGSSAESPLSPRRLPTLPTRAEAQGPAAESEAPAGQPLWPWFVMAALIFFVLEWLYSHRRQAAGAQT
jgi:Ca-activated chloride channel family protein